MCRRVASTSTCVIWNSHTVTVLSFDKVTRYNCNFKFIPLSQPSILRQVSFDDCLLCCCYTWNWNSANWTHDTIAVSFNLKLSSLSLYKKVNRPNRVVKFSLENIDLLSTETCYSAIKHEISHVNIVCFAWSLMRCCLLGLPEKWNVALTV